MQFLHNCAQLLYNRSPYSLLPDSCRVYSTVIQLALSQ
jgi:hypothetical protein